MRKKQPRIKSPKFVDEKLLGPEPEKVSGRVDLINAYNWYSHFLSCEDAKKYVLEYAKKFLNKQELQRYQETSDWKTTVTMGATARMIMRGVAAAEEFETRLKSQIQALLRREQKLAPVDAIKEKSNPLLEDVEYELDNFYRRNYKGTFDFRTMIAERNPSRWQLKKTVEFYEPLLTELNDPTAAEGYSRLKRPQKKQYVEFINSILTSTESALEGKKVVRKPRAKKKVDVAKSVVKLKYKKEDTRFSIKSLDPINIVNATELFLFNGKYNTLIKLVSSKTFQVKGTTILNVDMEKSSAKKIKPSKDFFQTFLKTRAVANREFKLLRGSTNFTCRTNDELVILMSNK